MCNSSPDSRPTNQADENTRLDSFFRDLAEVVREELGRPVHYDG